MEDEFRNFFISGFGMIDYLMLGIMVRFGEYGDFYVGVEGVCFDIIVCLDNVDFLLRLGSVIWCLGGFIIYGYKLG